VDPFARLAEVSGAPDAAACARGARALVGERLPGDAFAAACGIKRLLARRGFRDDARAFALHDMLAQRAGNCLGLSLLVGAALIDRGHGVAFALRVGPLDDVHDAGAEHFARLCDPERGVDEDSRLPEAGDRTRRFRFVPVEHASLVVDGRPFEATGLRDREADPGWAPEAESVRVVGFEELAAVVCSERAKAALREPEAPLRRALRGFVRAVRAWPENREAWGELWRVARAAGWRRLAAHAATRYADIAAAAPAQHDDSLCWFTRYRMTGDEALLVRALARLPSYAEAYLERHAAIPLARGASGDEVGPIRRHLAIAAWMFAGSEVLELEELYRGHGALFARAFSPEELAEVLATFGEPAGGGADSRT
jgi:hypothetical protein